MKTVKFRAPEIMCEGCAKSIKRALSTSTAVLSVDVGIESKLVTVGYDESGITPDEIKGLIEGAGYDASLADSQ